MAVNSPNITIVGAGIFGLSSAMLLADEGYQVTVIEKNLDIMQEASLVNQNRIHFGYHYPRSLETGREALEGLPSFKTYFGEAINNSFSKFYGIAKHGSYINVDAFEKFCRELEIPLEEKWPEEDVLNRSMIEKCWKVYEPVFDYYKLRELVYKEVNSRSNIRILRNTKIASAKEKDDGYDLQMNNGYKLFTSIVVNASYSGLSEVLNTLGIPKIKAHFELLVLPIIKIKRDVHPFGVTIMDGPFCSIMPKGFSNDEYILSHVKHSVIQSHLGYDKPEWNAINGNTEREIIDICRSYYPILEDAILKESWITTKMVLPNQDIDDARPTLVIKHTPKVYSLFSGKITTCISAAQNLVSQIKTTK